MNKILSAFATVLCFASCANTYNIEGTLNPAALDGQKVYLKVFSEDVDGYLTSLDSCEVTHGKFSFSGAVDSTLWANITMSGQLLVPVVLENGDIVVRIDNTQRTVSGTPQNEQLNTFYRSFVQFQNEFNEAYNRSDLQMIMNGVPEYEAYRYSEVQVQQLLSKADKEFTAFISSNYDNAAGPCAFWLLTKYGFMKPVWAEALMSNASSAFKSDGFVKLYYDNLKSWQADMYGTGVADSTANNFADVLVDAPKTPNEMAGDSVKKND